MLILPRTDAERRGAMPHSETGGSPAERLATASDHLSYGVVVATTIVAFVPTAVGQKRFLGSEAK